MWVRERSPFVIASALLGALILLFLILPIADSIFTSAGGLYEALMSEEVASPRRSDYELIREVRTPDPYTVKVRYKKTYAPALVSWSMHIIPKHILAGKPTDWWAQHFNRSPIGTGPFVLTEFVHQSHAKYKRFEDYWEEGLPYLDGAEFVIITDPMTQIASLKAGEIDANQKTIEEQKATLGTQTTSEEE